MYLWVVKPKMTVVVLDNAKIHFAQKVKERIGCWKEWKAKWLKPEDYLSFDTLAYATTQCLFNVGTELRISFSDYC